MLAAAIIRIIVVADDGRRSAVIDLMQNTVAGNLSAVEAREAVTPHFEKFLNDQPALRKAAANET